MGNWHARRWTTIVLLGISLTVATSVAIPHRAEAAEWCSSDPQPTGPPQYGACKGLLPMNALGSFLGSIMDWLQFPAAIHASVTAICEDAQNTLLAEFWDTHTKWGGGNPWAEATAPFCSFDHAGENRFVGDKFLFNGIVDFAWPFPIVPALVPINRYVGPIADPSLGGELTGGNLSNPYALTGAGVIDGYATVRAGISYGVLPLWDHARFWVNGTSFIVDVLQGRLHPQVIEAQVPISVLRFPGIAPNGYCPWPAQNFFRITMPGLNASIDWVEITIRTTPPIVLVPGDQTLNFKSPLMSFPCRSTKFLTSVGNTVVPYGGSAVPIQVVGSLSPVDLCATEAMAAWGNMISTISAEHYPVKTVDDMVQVPSAFNSDPDGWLMCDQAAGGTWTNNSPMNYYLNGAAKSMGVGTIDVIAHSKGGVDMLHYLKGPWYSQANAARALYVRNVATLSSGFKGVPLAAGYRPFRGTDPLPNGRPNPLGDISLVANFWQTLWSTFLTGILEPDHYAPFNEDHPMNGTPTIPGARLPQLEFLGYILDFFLNMACEGLGMAGREGVRMEQDPQRETAFTNQMLGYPWGGPAPKWVTFGANADSTNDDRLDQTCEGYVTALLTWMSGRGRLEHCIPGDDITGGIQGQVWAWSYLAIGTYYCRSWNPNGTCANWSDFKHNDAVVDEFSARLSNAYPHYVLDEYYHGGHSDGTRIGGNADHFQIYQERAPAVWTRIKSAWNYPGPLKTDQPW